MTDEEYKRRSKERFLDVGGNKRALKNRFEKPTLGGTMPWEALSSEDKEIKMNDWKLLRGRGGKDLGPWGNMMAKGLVRPEDDTGFVKKRKTDPEMLASRTLLGR